MLIVAGAAIVLASPAQASFPSRNGRIAFASDRAGLFDIYTMTPAGHDLRRLTYTRRIHELGPRWSPDGRRIVYSRRSFADENHPGPGEIWVMDARGGHEHRIARGGNPVWSPDGRRIAFMAPRGRPALWVMRGDGTHKRRLTLFDRGTSVGGLDWSPDGRWIAYVQDTGYEGVPSTRGVFKMRADGRQKQRLTPRGVLADGPSWSPGGTRVAFLRADATGSALTQTVWTMKPDGSDERQISDRLAFSCTWSPNGKWIAFDEAPNAPDGPYDVFTMRIDGTSVMNLTQNPAFDSGPSWQPLVAGGR